MPLNNVVKKMDKARDRLGFAPDEQVLAGCVTDPKGAVAVGLASGGLVGLAIQAAIDSSTTNRTSGGLATSWPKGRHLMAITSTRLIVCPMSAMSGKPKDIVAQWPHEAIASFVIEKSKLAYPFAITFTDGSVAQSEGAKGTGADDLEAAAAGIWH